MNIRKIFSILLFFCIIQSVAAQSLVFPPKAHSYGIRKADPSKLFMFFGPTTAFDNPQGIATAKMKSRDDPKTEADDDEVVVYGVNSNRHQIIYNTSMWGLALYGSKGSGKDQFLHPRGIAIDADGNVFVADAGNNRVVRLYNPDKNVRWVKSFNGARGGDSGLVNPQQLALDAFKRLYVCDKGNNRIVVFDSGNTVLRTIPSPGEFSFVDGPSGIALGDGRETWSYYLGDRLIFCTDRDGKRIWKLTMDGRVLDTVTLSSPYRAAYLATDFYHNLYCTDSVNGCILKFTHDLKRVDIFGSRGTKDNQFIEPRGIAFYKRYGQAFVAERDGAQYFWIGTGIKKSSWYRKSNGQSELSINLSEYGFISLFTANGRDTLYFFKNQFCSPGGAVFTFAHMPKETGSVRIRIEPTYSSRTYYSWVFPVPGK